jgi:carbonic anhydrase
LTTPPCSEGVRWIVLAQPIEMSNGQIDAFKKIFHDNHRPVQNVAGREVDRESD